MCIRYSSVPLRGETVTDSRDMNTEAGWVGQWKKSIQCPFLFQTNCDSFFRAARKMFASQRLEDFELPNLTSVTKEWYIILQKTTKNSSTF